MEQQKIKLSLKQKYPSLYDLFGIISFFVGVAALTWVMSSFIFRVYNVVGSSMENTMHNNDRIIINRLAVTMAHLKHEEYVPKRGDIIVFAYGGNTAQTNCTPLSGSTDKHLIKRVIAFPGERVLVEDGTLTVFNDEHPEGFNPDNETRKSETDGPKANTSGRVNIIVPEGEVFVSGDNREGANSYDSRSGLGTIPFCRIVGPVSLRFLPVADLRKF